MKIVTRLKAGGRTSPFLIDRCAALRNWARSGDLERLKTRGGTEPPAGTLVVRRVDLDAIPAVDTYVPLVDSGDTDAFVRLTHGGKTYRLPYRTDVTSTSWRGMSVAFPYREGAPLIVDLLDYNTALANHFIGSCPVPVGPNAGDGEGTGDLRTDLLQPSTLVEPPSVNVVYSVEEE